MNMNQQQQQQEPAAATLNPFGGLMSQLMGGMDTFQDVMASMAPEEAFGFLRDVEANLRFRNQNSNNNNNRNEQNSNRTPTASPSAIRQLPLITVTPTDLIDENNRTCIICYEPIRLSSKAIRLPCAHLYCPDCIVPWLSQQACTCPICRFELPTNDAEYERGRAERMKHRKPRYAMAELRAMSISKLLKLLPHKKHNYSFCDKEDVIEYLCQEGHVELIPTPEPYGSYRERQLQQMSISQLRKLMQDAGVFYYQKQVVEKEDLVKVLIASGRIELLYEEEEDTKPSPVRSKQRTVVVETVPSPDSATAEVIDKRADTSVLMEEDTSYKEDCKPPAVERPSMAPTNEPTTPLSPTRKRPRNSGTPDRVDATDTSTMDRASSTDTKSETSLETQNTASVSNPGEEEADADAALGSSEQVNEGMADSTNYPGHSQRHHDTSQYTQLSQSSIKNLRAIAAEHRVDLSDCLEKDEIIRRLCSSLNLNESASAAPTI